MELMKVIEYLHKQNMSADEKYEELIKLCSTLKGVDYKEDIKIIFESPLPLVKGVCFITENFAPKRTSGNVRTLITELPEKQALTAEVQMAWMRVLGINGKFVLDRWYISKVLDQHKKLYTKYYNSLSMEQQEKYKEFVSVNKEILGYRVLEYFPLDYTDTEAGNRCSNWYIATGIILG